MTKNLAGNYTKKVSQQMFIYFVTLFFETIEKVIFSCWVQLNTNYFQVFSKKRKLVITSEQIIQCNGKNGQVREQGTLSDLEGITTGLLQGSTSFIIHFKNKPSHEFMCEYRDEILEVIQ